MDFLFLSPKSFSRPPGFPFLSSISLHKTICFPVLQELPTHRALRGGSPPVLAEEWGDEDVKLFSLSSLKTSTESTFL